MTEKPGEPASEAGTREQSIEILDVGGESARTGAVREQDRTFKIAMTLAALIHALFFVSLIQSKPRRIGNPEGSQNAISVSILTEKDLKARAAIEDASNPAREGPAAPPMPTPPVPPEPPAKTEAPPLKPTTETPPPAPTEAPEKPVPPEAEKAEPPKEEPKPEDKKSEEQKTEEQKPDEQKTDAKTEAPPPVPDFETTTEKPDEKPLAEAKKSEQKPEEKEEKKPEEKPSEKVVDKALEDLLKKTDEALSAKAPPKKERTDTARAQKPKREPVPNMSMPGGGAGVQRPPGYTRSGENDAFARGVIRALQRTMPQLSNTFGTVTVRIDLDRNGNLVKVSVLKPSGVAGLDQSVTFAIQQSSFPLPPVNATPADLTFFVRYVYN